jgi:hypothetical protein
MRLESNVLAVDGALDLAVDCRRQAAYGRERFKNGTKGARRRRLEASDKLIGTLVAGTFRNGDFSSIKTGCCRPPNWIEKLNQRDAYHIDQAYWTREKRKWPVDLMGGNRHHTKKPILAIDPKLRQAILDTERLLREDELTSPAKPPEDVQLDYDENGFPRLPECLDRRPKSLLAEAA